MDACFHIILIYVELSIVGIEFIAAPIFLVVIVIVSLVLHILTAKGKDKFRTDAKILSEQIRLAK